MSAFYAMSNNKELLDKANKYDIKNYAWVSSKEQEMLRRQWRHSLYHTSRRYFITHIYFFNASFLLLVSPFLISPFY